MIKIIKSLFLLLIIAANGIGATAQDTPENRYLIENAVLGYYYTQLCPDFDSLVSDELKREFSKRGFYKKDLSEFSKPSGYDIDVFGFESLYKYMSIDFKFAIQKYNRLHDIYEESEDIMWGDMSDAEYVTIKINEIKFQYPHMATIKITLDYGVRTVTRIFTMHRWNNVWQMSGLVVSMKPYRQLWEHNGYESVRIRQGGSKSEGKIM